MLAGSNRAVLAALNVSKSHLMESAGRYNDILRMQNSVIRNFCKRFYIEKCLACSTVSNYF